MMKIKTSIFPKDGYVFRDTDGFLLKGKNWNDLARKVRDYRVSAGRPIGSPVDEITMQAGQRQPDLVYDDSRRVMPVPAPSLKSKILAWLFGFVDLKKRSPDEIKYVTAHEAAMRSEICAKCPSNVQFGASGCASCKQSLKSLRDNLIGNRTRFNTLNGCGVLATDLVVAVHLDEDRVENPNLPCHCWRKRAL